MEQSDHVAITGEVELILRDPDGREKELRTIRNLVVTTGKEGIADQMASAPSIGVPKYIAIGTGSTAAAAGDTALGTEVKRKEATSRTRSGAVLTMSVTFSAGEGTGALREAGILTASSGGTLYSRTVYELLNKEAGDALEVTWKLTVS
jgi:hypothetical protein